MANLRTWVVGSSPECDLVINQPAVSGKHCRLTRTAEGYVLEDTNSTNGTFVNGSRITGTVRVRESDAVTLGLSVPLTWPSDRPNAKAPAAAGSRPPIRIGGAADNDVVLEHQAVSQHHARVVFESTGAFLEDLKSTNGTSIGSRERRITRAALSERDTIFFGSLEVPASRILGNAKDRPAALTGSTKLLEFGEGPMTVGRDPDCDRVYDMPTVSGRHARLTRSKSTILIEDLNSANGTYVNGHRIDRSTPVAIGDRIGLGGLTLMLSEARQASAEGANGHRPSPNSNAKLVEIFISSPKDVAMERVIAERVIRRLADRHASTLNLVPVIWEDKPLLASDTFQNQIPPPSKFDIFVCVLWSRLGTPLPSTIRRPDGTTYQSGTEFEFEDAIHGFRKQGKPEMLVYRKTAEPSLPSLNDHAAVEDALLQHKRLAEFTKRWFHGADGTLTAASHQFSEVADFEKRLEVHLDQLVEKRARDVGVPVNVGTTVARVTWTEGSPYRGLEAFDFEHEALFFGRTQAVDGALKTLRDKATAGLPFLLVLAPSGSGKSSMVRAGLLPMLTQPGIVPNVSAWRRAVMRPSDAKADLFLGLASALLGAGALSEFARTTRPEALAEQLRGRPDRAVDIIDQALLKLGEKTRLVLLIDQMEEFFSSERITDSVRVAFFRLIETLCRRGVWVIATLRSDFYHRFAGAPELARLKSNGGQFDLLPPTPTEIASIIREPAVMAGLSFERDPKTGSLLDDVLCDAASKSPENLPLLEFLLDELYNRRSPRDNTLTFQAYQELGGLEGALANRAQETFSRLPADVQAKFPRVFRLLVAIGETTASAATRKPAPLETLYADPASGKLVTAFVQARLFVSQQGADGIPVTEIAHEALLRSWEPLRQWIVTDRELLRARSRVAAVARTWDENNRSSDRLLAPGQPLDEAKRLVKAGFELSRVELALISASTIRAAIRKQSKNVFLTTLSVATVVSLAALVFGFYNSSRAGKSFIAARLMVDTYLKEIVQEGLRDVPGVQDSRKNLAIDATKKYKEFVEDHPGDPEVRTGFVKAQTAYGLIEAEIGSLVDAKKILLAAIETQKQVIEDNPGVPAYLFQLAITQRGLGTLCWESGENEEARPYLKAAIDALETLHDHTPSNLEYQEELATSCNVLGNVLRELGDVNGGSASYERARVIFRDLIRMRELIVKNKNDDKEEERTNKKKLVSGYIGYSATIHNQSLIEKDNGNYANASTLMEKSKYYDDQATRISPDAPRILINKSIGLRNQGDLLMSMKEKDKAKSSFLEALSLSQKALNQNPMVSRFQWVHAENQKAVARYWKLAGDRAKAEASYKACCATLRDLIKQREERPDFGVTLIKGLSELAEFQKFAPSQAKFSEAGKADEDQPEYIRALDRAVDAAHQSTRDGRFPLHPGLNYQLAKALYNRAIPDYEAERYKAAMPFLEECLNVYRDRVMTTNLRKDEEIVKDYLVATRSAVESAEHLEQSDRATKWIEAARATGKDCKNREGRATLAALLCSLGKVHTNAGRIREATNALDQALKICNADLVDSPWNWYLNVTRTTCYKQLAILHRRTGDFAGEIQAHRDWLRVWGEPYQNMKYSHQSNAKHASTESEAVRIREFVKNEPSMKRFTIPVEIDGLNCPIYIYITNVKYPDDPFGGQGIWLEKERGGQIPKDVVDAFGKLHKIAHENNVSFTDLCVYALGTASKSSIEGAWSIISLVQNGEDMTAWAPFDTMVIDGDTFMLLKGNSEYYKNAIKFDFAKSPTEIDWTWKSPQQTVASAGVIAVENDILLICCDFGGKDRPAVLDSKPGSGHLLLKFQRKSSPKP